MNDVSLLHVPRWQLVETDWHLMIGNRTLAVLIPNSDTRFPRYKWLSRITCGDCEACGWDSIDFETLESAEHDIEQWWLHARRGKAYRP
jgi:hypothetical protein